MVVYRPGTNIQLTEEDYLDLTLMKLSRLAHKGMHQNRYVFLVHEAREILQELLDEVRDVKNTPVEDKDWPKV